MRWYVVFRANFLQRKVTYEHKGETRNKNRILNRKRNLSIIEVKRSKQFIDFACLVSTVLYLTA